MINYFIKYLKYKKKYLSLINQKGGTYKCIQTLKTGKLEIKAIAFNTTGTILATNNFEPSITLWKVLDNGSVDIKSAIEVKPEISGDNVVVSIVFYTLPDSSHNEYLLVIGFTKCVSFWLVSAKTGVITRTPIIVSTPITNSTLTTSSTPISEKLFTSVAVHPTIPIIAISSEDKTVKIWKFSSITDNQITTDLIMTLQQPIRINSVAFHTKLPLLAMGGRKSSSGIAKVYQFTYERETFEINTEVIVANNENIDNVIFHPTKPYLVISDIYGNLFKGVSLKLESLTYMFDKVMWEFSSMTMTMLQSSIAVHPTKEILARSRFDHRTKSNIVEFSNVEFSNLSYSIIDTVEIDDSPTITYIILHPTLPLIIVGSVDGIIRIYRKN
jgi:WD40 repeat protein